jgi:hypothetical protein
MGPSRAVLVAELFQAAPASYLRIRWGLSAHPLAQQADRSLKVVLI